MAYTEKVSLSGTALSFLLYECVNSVNSQEGFLIGDITSEVTNHISDSQSDNARLDTQIVIRTVLPLPSVSLFYLPTGRIKEDVLADVLSNSSSEVVGWYKYRKNNNIKPTFRDKLISKGLQKYFEKHHGKKTFVTCNLTSRTSSAGSTHTFIYRFGKINCFDMYEYIDDVTANLGEKHTGYKKANRLSPHTIFNKIVKESNVQSNNSSDAILRIQEAVNVRLLKEASIAAKSESIIRELEAEIKQMNNILAEKQASDLQQTYDSIVEEKFMNRELEMARACVQALSTPPEVDILNVPNILMNRNHIRENAVQANEVEPSKHSIAPTILSNTIESDSKWVLKRDRSPSPVLMSSSSVKPVVLNYAAALKNKSEKPSTSKTNNFSEDLISFDIEENHVQKQSFQKDDVKCVGDSSPEY